MVECGVLQPLLAMAAPISPARRSDSREAVEPPMVAQGEAAQQGALEDEDAPEVDEEVWAVDLRRVAARALLQLTSRPSMREALVAAGGLFRWLELAASDELAVVALGVQALRQVSESEEHRGRMLAEPSLLQALVSLTASDDAEAMVTAGGGEGAAAQQRSQQREEEEAHLRGEVTKHAMLTILHLSTSSAHAAVFLQLLPAMPLGRLARSGGAELQHACARLIFLLARPSGGCSRSMQLSEAAAAPLVTLCEVPHPKVRSAAAPRPL